MNRTQTNISTPSVNTLEDLLAEWQNAKNNMSRWQEHERMLRGQVIAATFANLTEGTNKHQLPDGRNVKVVCSITRSIENSPKLDAILAKLEKAGVDVDTLVPFKPSLSKKAYDALSSKHRAAIDEVITSKPGAPQLSIE